MGKQRGTTARPAVRHRRPDSPSSTGWRHLHVLRRLTLMQVAFLLPALGLVAAFLVGISQSIWSSLATLHAKNRGPAEVCSDLVSQHQTDEIKIVGRAPWGFNCEAQLSDGTIAMQEHSAGTSALFYLAAGLAVLSLLTLFGVAIAAIAKWAATALVGRTESRADGCAQSRTFTWGISLLMVGCFLLPWTIVAQHALWYSASNSGGTVGCPSTFHSADVLGYSIEASYLPPYLTCSGDTASGARFSATAYGFPFHVFLGCLVLFAVAVGLLIAARLRRKRL